MKDRRLEGNLLRTFRYADTAHMYCLPSLPSLSPPPPPPHTHTHAHTQNAYLHHTFRCSLTILNSPTQKYSATWRHCYHLLQSERLHLYQSQARELISRGSAYPCFCSRERLHGLRSTHLGYDGRCRRLSERQAEENIRMGLDYTVRLKVSRAPCFPQRI